MQFLETHSLFQQTGLSLQYITTLAVLKLGAMALLLYSEYLFLIWPICRNETEEFAMAFPYTAFIGAVILALTYIGLTMGITRCDLAIYMRIEMFLSLVYCIGMFCVCQQTLIRCERPKGFLYKVPEVVATLVWVILFLNTIYWFRKLSLKRKPGQRTFFT